MKGADEVVDLLNEVLTAELTAVNAYFGHAKLLQHWGYERLAAKYREESIDEMRHAEALIDRILYLEGHPNLQRLSPVKLGERPVEALELDLEGERDAVARLGRGISICTAVADHGTRGLLERILDSEEEHVDWLETQLETIRQIGEPLWLSQQLA